MSVLPLIIDVKNTLDVQTLSAAEMAPVEFEKDDDSNGHVDFITAAAVSCCLPAAPNHLLWIFVWSFVELKSHYVQH